MRQRSKKQPRKQKLTRVSGTPLGIDLLRGAGGRMPDFVSAADTERGSTLGSLAGWRVEAVRGTFRESWEELPSPVPTMAPPMVEGAGTTPRPSEGRALGGLVGRGGGAKKPP